MKVNFSGNTRGLVGTLTLVMVAALTACGGGGVTGTPISGKVVDGYIKGANVCVDLNGSGSCDAGEPSATTGDGGDYTLYVQEGTSVVGKYLVAEVSASAEDSDNPGQPAKPAKLLAFADQPKLITPLTTVVAGFAKADTTLTPAQAEIKARTLLGLPADYSFQSDFIAESDTSAHAAARVMYRGLSNVVGTSAISGDLLKLTVANTVALAKNAYADPTQVTTLLATADSDTRDAQLVYETLAVVDLKKFSGYENMRSRFVPQYDGPVAAGYRFFPKQEGQSDISVTDFSDYLAQVNGENQKLKIDLYASQQESGLSSFRVLWMHPQYSWGRFVDVTIPPEGVNSWRTYEIDLAAAQQLWGDFSPSLAGTGHFVIRSIQTEGFVNLTVGKVQLTNDDWQTSVTINPKTAWCFNAEGFSGNCAEPVYWDPYPEFVIFPTEITQRGDAVKMIKTATWGAPYSGMTQTDFASGLSGSSITMEIDVYQQSSSFPFNVVAQKAGDYTVATSVAELNADSADATGTWKTYRFTLANFDAAVHTELVILPDPGVVGSDQTMYVSNLRVVGIYDPFN